MARVRTGSRRGDGGQLLLLAGIILALGFITTAITLSQVSTMEKQVTTEQNVPLLTEYRFIRDRIGTTLRDATTTSTDDASFDAIFRSMDLTFRRMAQEKGYDFTVKLASAGAGFDKSEWSFTDWGWPDRRNLDGTADDGWYNSGNPLPSGSAPPLWDDNPAHSGEDGVNAYWLYSTDGRVRLGQSSPVPFDGTDDGVVHVDPITPGCDIDPAVGCIQAVIVHLRVADSTSSIEEIIVYGLNAQ